MQSHNKLELTIEKAFATTFWAHKEYKGESQ